MTPKLLQSSLQHFHGNSPEACQSAAEAILEQQSDHPLGMHLLAWSRLEQGLPCEKLLNNIIKSPETKRVTGIPAKATAGWMLWQSGRTGAAIKMLADNVQREPNRQDLQTVLGICLLADDQAAAARPILQSIVSQSPANPVPRFHLAHALLHLGEWKSGFEEFEKSRFNLEVRQTGQYESCPEKLWIDQDLTGKSIVVEGEQGFGDQIQFIRFADHLRNQFGASEVHFSCHPAISDLMQSADDLDSAAGRIYSGFDYHVPVMSLPHRCRIRVDQRLYSRPWLRANPDHIAEWQAKLPRRSGYPRIGIFWRSAPVDSAERQHKLKGVNFIKTLKSMNTTDLSHLVASLNGNADIISLQPQITDEEREMLQSSAASIPDIINFTDTAAIIEQCDAIITIDSAVAHLAGALGKRTRVLLPKGADWRWSHSNHGRSIWYPSVSTHRQDRERDWTSPIESAIEEIFCESSVLLTS